MAEYLHHFKSVHEYFEFNGPPNLLKPEYTDEKLIQFEEIGENENQNEIWLQTAQNKWRIREIICMLLSETNTINLSRSALKTSTSVDKLWCCSFTCKNPILAHFTAASCFDLPPNWTNFQNSCPCQSHRHTQGPGWNIPQLSFKLCSLLRVSKFHSCQVQVSSS